MEDTFEGLDAEFKDLDPSIQAKAVELAKQLIRKGYEKEAAIKEAIKLAEERFLDLEG